MTASRLAPGNIPHRAKRPGCRRRRAHSWRNYRRRSAGCGVGTGRRRLPRQALTGDRPPGAAGAGRKPSCSASSPSTTRCGRSRRRPVRLSKVRRKLHADAATHRDSRIARTRRFGKSTWSFIEKVAGERSAIASESSPPAPMPSGNWSSVSCPAQTNSLKALPINRSGSLCNRLFLQLQVVVS